MNTLRLALSYSKSLFLNNKALYIFFAAVLAVTAFGYMVFFSSTYEAGKKMVDMDVNSRTYYLNFSSPPDNVESIRTLTEENEYAEVLNIRYGFGAEISGEPVELCSYLNEDFLPDVYKGRSFDEADERVIVMLSPNLAEDYTFGSAYTHIKKMQLGEKTGFSGKPYTVIGYCNTGEIIIPYNDGIKDFPLVSASIEIATETGETRRTLFSNYLRSTFPSAELIEPEPIGQKAISGMSVFLYGGLLIGVSAFLTFIFLFVYIIGRNMKDYIILRICGCSFKKMCALLTGQLAAVYTVSFIAAFGIARVLSLFIGSTLYINLNVSFLQAAAVYAVTLIMIAVIYLPYAVSAARKTVASVKSSD